MTCKHAEGVKFCQTCAEEEIAELRVLLERERVISGGLREDRDGIVKNWRECEKKLEKLRARSDRSLEPQPDEITDAELDALAEHFEDYVSGPGYDVLRAVAALRRVRRELGPVR